MLPVGMLKGPLNPLSNFYKENLIRFGFLASIFPFGKFLYESYKTFTISIEDDF